MNIGYLLFRPKFGDIDANIDAMIRLLPSSGAQIICQPANLVLQWCQRTIVVRGVENRVFKVTSNRYGT